MKPREGLTLGNRYRLVRRIAIGGMGEVWVANDHALGREVAVKVLREEYAGNEDFLNRLRTEARNSAALSHRNIAQMYDYGEQNSSGYLVMELVVGEPMADLLEREPVLPPSRLLPILSQTARALHAAHVAGVVHRDVKPGNILLERSGDVKITDFGVSLAANQVPMTAAGMVMGTAQYLSPEQAIGQAATGASDVYALGIVAYESVTGNRPFTGSTPVDIAVAHVNEPVPPLPASVHPDLAALILSMLAKDPVERPSTAATLARTFDELAVRIAEDPWGATARAGASSSAGPRRSRRARTSAEHSPPVDVPPGVSTDVTPEITPLVIPDAVRRDEDSRAAGAGTVPDDAPPAGETVAALPWERPAPSAGSSRSRAAEQETGDGGAGRAEDAADGAYPMRRDMHGATRSRRTAPATRSRSGGAQRPPSIRPQNRRGPAPETRARTSRTERPAEPAARSAARSTDPAGAAGAAGSTRAERRRASQQAAPSPHRTSTTTGLRIGGLPKGVSWPLLALLGLLLVLLVATILGRPDSSDADALGAAPAPVGAVVREGPGDADGQTGHIVTTSLRGDHDISAPDGMILEAAAPKGAPAVPTTLKDA